MDGADPGPDPDLAAGPDAGPAPARKRLASVAAGRARSSLESVGGGLGLAGAGFDPLTEVMGCAVVHLGWFSCSCGFTGMNGTGPGGTVPVTLVSGLHKRGFAPYGKALQKAWDTALGRLLAEAGAVGADGVVGIRATRTRLPANPGTDEFVLLGTAVRARGRVRPQRPFATDLGGDRFAVLVRAGWIPVGYRMTAAIGVRHDDWRVRRTSSIFNGNQEVAGFTDLVHDTRRAVRDQFAVAMARLGAETAVVADMTMTIRESRAGQEHTDHLCEVAIAGTGLVSYDRSDQGAGDAAGHPGGLPMTVLPLTDRPLTHRTRTDRTPTDSTPTDPALTGLAGI